MRKLILGVVMAATVLASSAKADEWQHRRWEGPRPGYGYEHRGGNNWVAPMVGGLFIGGMLAEMQNNYYRQQYQPVCQRVFIGNVVVDGQMVQAFKTICQ